MNVRNWTGYTHTENRGLTQRCKGVRNRARMQLAVTLRESHTQRGEASSKSPLLRRLFAGRSLATDRRHKAPASVTTKGLFRLRMVFSQR